jgi:Uma2 family endonuclease
VEFRAYNLRPGTRDEFHRLVVEESLPLLDRHGMDVVACGPSPHDEDSYYLVRSFASLAAREREEDAFYGSQEWRSGPREAIVSRIESMTSVVIELDEATVNGLRAGPVAGLP